jgi:hypothetical protein
LGTVEEPVVIPGADDARELEEMFDACGGKVGVSVADLEGAGMAEGGENVGGHVLLLGEVETGGEEGGYCTEFADNPGAALRELAP